jgi:hypothetical protein
MGETQLSNGIPKRHCGLQEAHFAHPNTAPLAPHPVDGTYCDGVPELGSFVELAVRVPLAHFFGDRQVGQKEALNLFGDEGLGLFLDEFLQPIENGTRAVLRVRAGGEDQVYPLTCEPDTGFPGFRVVFADDARN